MNYHDEIWLEVPEGREPPHWPVRTAFCLSLAGPGEDVLDLGCGDGAMLAELASAGVRPVGVDVSAVALERAARRGRFELHRVAVGDPLPFADSTFDGVWASEVLGQAMDPGGLLREAHRVLRPGGWLAVTTPRHGRIREALATLARFDRTHHPGSTTLRRYSPRTLADQLREYGFEHVSVRAGGGPPGIRRLLMARATRP